MNTQESLDFFGKVLINDVRNEFLKTMLRDLFSTTRFKLMIDLRKELKIPDMTAAQTRALRDMVILSADYLLGRVLTTAEHNIANGNLEIKISKVADLVNDAYTVHSMDSIASMYYGEGSWVDRYGDPKYAE